MLIATRSRGISKPQLPKSSRIGEYYLARAGFGFWVAEDNGVIGTVGIERASSTTAELRRMAVAKAHRRKGVARQRQRVFTNPAALVSFAPNLLL